MRKGDTCGVGRVGLYDAGEGHGVDDGPGQTLEQCGSSGWPRSSRFSIQATVPPTGLAIDAGRPLRRPHVLGCDRAVAAGGGGGERERRVEPSAATASALRMRTPTLGIVVDVEKALLATIAWWSPSSPWRITFATPSEATPKVALATVSWAGACRRARRSPRPAPARRSTAAPAAARSSRSLLRSGRRRPGAGRGCRRCGTRRG